ncbi:hypothetical protein EZS27_020614 [termite gut metagenome]|uniref:Uncharacterized protein n=1 Tax=termite gut metagenome TaxID=433724 RepID=A0A5J4RBH4_9ZZZZ
MFDWLFTPDWNSPILNVKWFGLTYFILILLMAVAIVGLYFLFRHKTQKTKMILFWGLFGVAFLSKLWNLIFWYTPLSAVYQEVANPAGVQLFPNYLLLDPSSEHFNIARWINGAFPWSLCGLNLYFIPIYLISKKPFWKQFGFTTMMIGAVLGIVLSVSFHWPNPWIFFDYYLNHFAFLAIPLLIVLLGEFKPRYRLMGKSFFTLIGLLLVAFLISMVLNWTLNPEYRSLRDNDWYFSSLWTIKGDTVPFNLLWNILPVPFVYLFLLLPVVGILWFLVILPFDKVSNLKYLWSDFKTWGYNLFHREKRSYLPEDITK